MVTLVLAIVHGLTVLLNGVSTSLCLAIAMLWSRADTRFRRVSSDWDDVWLSLHATLDRGRGDKTRVRRRSQRRLYELGYSAFQPVGARNLNNHGKERTH